MFSRIQTRYFRSLKAVDQSLGPVQALVGPNASGKTTFLDVIGLLSDLVRNRGDVRETILSRSASFDKLIWQGPGEDYGQRTSFQIAVEAEDRATAEESKLERRKIDAELFSQRYIREFLKHPDDASFGFWRPIVCF